VILERHFAEPLEEIITIEIFGERFSFKADIGLSDPVEVADFLSREIIKASETFPGKSSETNKFAVLLSAALNITSEFFDLKKTYLSLSKGVTEKSEVLISKIKKITG